MAAQESSAIKTSIPSPTLLEQLATVLPKDISFNIYHLSTPPTRATALYNAPPGARPDRTYCESHFLTVSIATPAPDNASKITEVLVYAIEILIYSTAHDTTFFVSKADSTGYLHLLNLPKGTPSPIRDISAVFLRYLVEQHQRKNIRSVISLFARAQDQYLFPGSVEYSGKHVLDDRGLVRWWCRVLDPLIEESQRAVRTASQWDTVKGYLVVPGLDSHETLSCIPRKTPTNKLWTIGHPLQEISRHGAHVAPRSLIPHFPDDPKARFLDELDDEITKSQNSSTGHWKSVKSIDQFWDMMAFRQECSAGRMVGFIWIVFNPIIQHQPTESLVGDSQSTTMTNDSQMKDVNPTFSSTPHPTLPLSPEASFTASSQPVPTSSPSKRLADDLPSASQQSTRSCPLSVSVKKRKALSGHIVPRQPRVKTENKNYLLERPESTAYYLWRSEGRGQIIVDESDYKRVTELLLRLDFANFELASSSSRRWINEVRSGAQGSMRDAWGQTVTGTKILETKAASGTAGVNSLNMGLVRKKRKVGVEEPLGIPAPTIDSAPQVNILSAGMIRKKAKV